ncbi:MAG: biotin/lipoyl-binding protein, partial [Betaproteobacteria bacterium]|nr:biotin/lipoyl-binding protein [Betaproteobacteria bacterium]
MKKPAKELSGTAIEFQPDADALEKAPVAKGVPITLYTIIAMMLAFLVWAGIAEIDQVVVSSGRLISTEPNIIIQPIETAQIEAINVTVGQSVKKGEVLARLEPTFITADLSQVKEKLKSLNAQIKRLEAEKEGRDLPTQRLAEQDQLQLSLDLEKQSGFRARI